MVATLFVCAALAQVEPGPIDAYRANLASVAVDMDFTCSFYYLDDVGDVVSRLEKFEPAYPAGDPALVYEGHWSFDGVTEDYVVKLTGGTMHDPEKKHGPLVPVELISDGTFTAFHYLIQGESILHIPQGPEFPVPVVGPLTFSGSARLDREIENAYGNSVPERKTGLRSGYRTDLEIYKKKTEFGELRRKIAYDPQIGYLPRFYRGMSHGVDKGRSEASVKDVYLIEARPCSKGGFVPIEWFMHTYHINDFDSSYPNYDDSSELTPSDTSTIVHFKVTQTRDLSPPVRLRQAAEVDRIFAPGGAIKGEVDSMTVKQLVTRIGNKMKPSQRAVLPRIDEAERREFDRPAARTIPTSLLAALGTGIVLVVLFLARRRFHWAAAIALAVLNAGCGSHPTVGVEAEFSPGRVLFDARAPSLKVGLNVKNTGNQTLRLFSVSSGCTCRHIDTTRLPLSIAPGSGITLTMSLSGSREFEPQNFMFMFDTNFGRLSAPAALFSLPRNHLMPPSITLTTLSDARGENEPSFEVLHREVYEPNTPMESAELTLPQGFIGQKADSFEGRVAGAPEFAFRDTTYRIRLKDASLGLHKAMLRVSGPSGGTLIDMPVVWERAPFLSSVPDRVVLSSRPMRAFLRCGDPSIELLRVLSAPEGVKAVVSSVREITVSLAENAPPVINDVVKVETTAKDQPPLAIKVARYAPLVSSRSKEGFLQPLKPEQVRQNSSAIGSPPST